MRGNNREIERLKTMLKNPDLNNGKGYSDKAIAEILR